MVVWLNIAARAASYGIAMAAVLASVATASEPLEPPDPTDPAVIERIDGFLQDELRDAGIPGLAVAIVADGKVVHVRGFGVADETGRPVTPDTPFQLASVSKAFTATAIMQLVARGDVELDAPVTTYLPWFRVGDGTASADITIRQLLTHTSGITRDPWASSSSPTSTTARCRRGTTTPSWACSTSCPVAIRWSRACSSRRSSGSASHW